MHGAWVGGAGAQLGQEEIEFRLMEVSMALLLRRDRHEDSRTHKVVGRPPAVAQMKGLPTASASAVAAAAAAAAACRGCLPLLL